MMATKTIFRYSHHHVGPGDVAKSRHSWQWRHKPEGCPPHQSFSNIASLTKSRKHINRIIVTSVFCQQYLWIIWDKHYKMASSIYSEFALKIFIYNTTFGIENIIKYSWIYKRQKWTGSTLSAPLRRQRTLKNSGACAIFQNSGSSQKSAPLLGQPVLRSSMYFPVLSRCRVIISNIKHILSLLCSDD